MFEEELKKEEEEKIKKEKIEIQKKIEEKRIYFSNVSVEPKENEEKAIQIIFRLPDGSKISRKFYNYEKIQVIFIYFIN